MKKTIIMVMAALVLTASVGFAQEATVTLKGDIIDTMCAGEKNAEQLSAFVPTHTKECAMAPQCAASGYNIFSNGKLLKLDTASNAKVVEYLKGADSKLQVEVMAKQTGDTLSVVSIKKM